jgi:hypothetical protein
VVRRRAGAAGRLRGGDGGFGPRPGQADRRRDGQAGCARDVDPLDAELGDEADDESE